MAAPVSSLQAVSGSVPDPASGLAELRPDSVSVVTPSGGKFQAPVEARAGTGRPPLPGCTQNFAGIINPVSCTHYFKSAFLPASFLGAFRLRIFKIFNNPVFAIGFFH